MKFLLIYPKWEKLDRQTRFTLPPHGPVVMAAALPEDVDVIFIDENVEPIDFNAEVDFVGISMMLTAQIKRGWEIADTFRARGVKVMCGGIATMLHAEECHIADRGEANLILATGASQFEMLASLVTLDIEWPKVTAFHLDEYIGLPDTHPASFRLYLRGRFVDRVAGLRAFHFVNGEHPDPIAE
ncbi:MAG: hypothetical protein R6W75_05030, partial [Smithellaceae bacterium]